MNSSNCHLYPVYRNSTNKFHSFSTDCPSDQSQDLNSVAIETALQAVPIGIVAKDLNTWSESEVLRGIIKSTLSDVVGDRVDSALNAATESDASWAAHLEYLVRTAQFSEFDKLFRKHIHLTHFVTDLYTLERGCQGGGLFFISSSAG